MQDYKKSNYLLPIIIIFLILLGITLVILITFARPSFLTSQSEESSAAERSEAEKLEMLKEQDPEAYYDLTSPDELPPQE